MNDMTAGMTLEDQEAEAERQALLTPEELAAEQESAMLEAHDKLRAAIEAQEGVALGGETDPISTMRAKAIDYYLGEPFGNEIEGRSQVVSKDVFDTVEWIKPALIRVFASGEQICEFAPQGEADVQQAEQESDYIDYVIQRKNAWLMIALEWFTDALLTRNAYAMGYWEDKVEPTLERYKGLTEDQLALIAMDQSVQIVSHEAYQVPMPLPPEMQLLMMQQGAMGPPPVVALHDVDVRRMQNYGCVKISVLPPERCLIAQNAPGMSVRKAEFFEYWEYKTLSQLRDDGFDVPDDLQDSSGIDRGVIDQARDVAADTLLGQQVAETGDPSMRRVKARMCWIRHDYDGDGIAELRYVLAVGDTFLANQEIPEIPVACIVPIPMPHRHIGLSVHDMVSDIQLIKSALERQVIDNTYLANNGRYGVDKNRVNLDDMAISRPGGMVRTDGPPGECILPFMHPQTAAQGITVLQYLDGIRQDRGGVQQPMAGADLTSIMAQPGTVAQLAQAASQKIELIARVFGEGVKELFQVVHEIILQNPTVQEKVELRGKWVTVDPRQWQKRHDMSLMVGMGVGNRTQTAGALQTLINLQKEALPIGLTSYPKIYHSLSRYAEALGFSSGEQFFDEPPLGAKYQPPEDPRVTATKIQEQGDLLVQKMKNDATVQITQLKEEAAAARSYFETMIDNQNQAQDRFVRAMSEATERMQEMRLESAKSPVKAETAIHIAGLDGISNALKETQAAVKQNEETTKATSETVKELKAASAKKPRKRTITAPSGKKYDVEDKE